MSGLPPAEVFRKITETARMPNWLNTTSAERLDMVVANIFLHCAMYAAGDGKFNMELPASVIATFVECDVFVDKLNLAGYEVDVTNEDFIVVCWGGNPNINDNNKI